MKIISYGDKAVNKHWSQQYSRKIFHPHCKRCGKVCYANEIGYTVNDRVCKDCDCYERNIIPYTSSDKNEQQLSEIKCRQEPQHIHPVT